MSVAAAVLFWIGAAVDKREAPRARAEAVATEKVEKRILDRLSENAETGKQVGCVGKRNGSPGALPGSPKRSIETKKKRRMSSRTVEL